MIGNLRVELSSLLCRSSVSTSPLIAIMADRVGFEPTGQLLAALSLSKRVPLTTQPPIQNPVLTPREYTGNQPTMADGVGFEPTGQLLAAQRFSKPPQSSTLPPIQLAHPSGIEPESRSFGGSSLYPPTADVCYVLNYTPVVSNVKSKTFFCPDKMSFDFIVRKISLIYCTHVKLTLEWYIQIISCKYF